ncbi:zinc finger domain-containing protein [Streptomyces drozdowiczii]|uniref:DNA-binding phage zinc finger domain-containing protein n=1 Tax=Streptomyces drozdowiczii TaxID=202862 RepID=A0ABY6PQ10_9ACTN|nr:hypothetical protein [Streptomyces drozdowiczii]MCX0246439.1 hypothetical protein [Streptomyces drozdowiczii]UZK54059.1 hypothetical protein NEH16_07760 [Streptomyces drozdowiczii]
MSAPRPVGLGRPRPAALAVPCPHCHATTGAPCTIPATGGRLTDPHPSRIEQQERAA